MSRKINRKIKIWFIISPENLFHPIYVHRVIEKLPKDKYEVLGITVAAEKHKKGFLNSVYRQISLWGIFPFFFIVLVSLTRSGFSKLGITKYTVLYDIAKHNKLKYIIEKNVNTKEHVELLQNKKVDVIISSSGQIFKKELLDSAKIACINRHTALLPHYGGVLPLFWAMYHTEKESGVSMHYMVEEVDRGDILSKVKMPLLRGNSLFKNYLSAFKISVDATLIGLENLRNGEITERYRKVKNGYFSFPVKEDIVKFKKRNKTFNISDVISYFKYLI